MRTQAGSVLSGCLRSMQLFLAFALAAGTWGCSTVHRDFKLYSPTPLRAGGSVKAAIVLPDALCSLHYDNRNLTEFDLGPTICSNARLAARAAFSDVSFYSESAQADKGDVDVVGILRPGSVRTHGTKQIPATVSADVDLIWSFRTVDGTRGYEYTIYGHGEDTRTFGMADIRNETSMQRCMDDLAKNLQREMAAAYVKAGINTVATKNIRAQVESFKAGQTTYGDYRKSKTKSWYIFAIDEHAKYDGSLYAYLYTSGSGKHDSTMGSCTTHWLRPWPAIDDLRPSVYLAESTIDKSRIGDFYLKETVGSAYDNHPLCELVFEGNDFDNARLSQSSCDRDYSKDEVYASIDHNRKYELNETARKWIKLRPGMSKQEMAALVGPPAQMIYSSFTDRWLYEYGYGRIRDDGHERLLFWQLRDLPSKLQQLRSGDNQQMSGCLAN